MNEAIARDERAIIGNLPENEKTEVIKEFPTNILLDELKRRTEYCENKLMDIAKIIDF